MSWSSWAKSIAKEAQRGIDKVLEIQEDGSENPGSGNPGEPARSDPENPDPSGIPPERPRPKPIEIGSQEKPPLNGNDGWDDKQWDEGWDNESKTQSKKPKPLKMSKSPRKTPPKKSSPKNRMKAAKIITESETLTNGSAENAPTETVPEKTEDKPVPEPVSAVVEETEKSPEPPEVKIIEPKIEPEFAANKSIQDNSVEIDHLTEHADSLANSFQLTMQQLHQREQQLIVCSTSNATLLAENDELKSQNEFLSQFQDQAKSVPALNSRIEPTL